MWGIMVVDDMPKEEVGHAIHNEVYFTVLKNLVNKAWKDGEKWAPEAMSSFYVLLPPFPCFKL